MSLIVSYIHAIKTQFATGSFTEHTFRPALITLIESLNTNIIAQNETQRIAGVGMPDITIIDRHNHDIKSGWIECKDLDVDLSFKKNTNQLNRYLTAFDNFIYTNNLQFDFYRGGRLVDTVRLGFISKDTLVREDGNLLTDNHEKLLRLLTDFLGHTGQTIKSPLQLANSMAGKARLIAMVIENILSDKNDAKILKEQFDTFKTTLIHDLDIAQFADMYAQTIVYGLFVARLHDPTLPTFSRAEAETLIPKSTPFLKRLFRQIASDDEFDDRINYIIDDLVAIFLHTNVADIINNYKADHDPIIHFYEDFLAIYNAETRKKRGVYYTPKPVVNFIIRTIDRILRTDFGLSQGLADTSKITMADGQTLHRVQVLDPATGTGTFLHELIIYLHDTYFATMQGNRTDYVASDLLPRLFGFELMMASYAMCHLRLGLTLQSTGYDRDDQRIGVYLTNSLEQATDALGGLRAKQLAEESKKANEIKSTQPIMIVMGNPPYAVSSSNKSAWINELITVYKKDLNEKKINLDDDYIKFIRFAEYEISKTGEGIVGLITNNSFIDGITHRQMRKHLMETFDSISIIDLHGNSKKKEVSPDGSKDENVFDIMQGVSIIIAVKKGPSSPSCRVSHIDVRGRREEKFAWLAEHDQSVCTPLTPIEPYYFFVPKDFSQTEEYEKGVKVNDLFAISNSGVKTDRDSLFIDDSHTALQHRMVKLLSRQYDGEFARQYRVEDSSSYKLTSKIAHATFDNAYLTKIDYRPFDTRWIYYDPKVISRPAYEIMQHMLHENIGLLMKRQCQQGFSYIFATQGICESCMFESAYANNSIFPLYLYNTKSDADGSLRESDGEEGSRIPNINLDIIDPRLEDLGLSFGFFSDPTTEIAQHWDTDLIWQRGKDGDMCSPDNILDYVYAILHHPVYRSRYAPFLKIDFPRVPLITDKDVFWTLVEHGRRLRRLHLMEDIAPSSTGISYPLAGDNIIEKVKWVSDNLSDGVDCFVPRNDDRGRVMINATQYFDGVSETAWKFFIGGYQPAQKRLKDRKGRKLSTEDSMHYMKICFALEQTDRLMQELGTVKIF